MKSIFNKSYFTLTKLLSLLSAFIFLVGTAYYSYIIYKVVYMLMHKAVIKELSDGTMGLVMEFSLSNINSTVIFAILSGIIICGLGVALTVFAIKGKFHLFGAISSVPVIIWQFFFKNTTLLQEFNFARYVLHFGASEAINIGVLIKYIPFIIVLILSITAFIISIRSKSLKDK